MIEKQKTKGKCEVISPDQKHLFISNVIDNFSSNHLTPEEEYALSFSLDNHIPTKVE